MTEATTIRSTTAATAIRPSWHVYIQRELISKSLTVALGALAVIWSLISVSTYRYESHLTDTARRILSGETFNANQLDPLRRLVDSIPSARSLTAADIAVIRLRILENEFAGNSGKPLSALSGDFEVTKAAVLQGLAGSPTNSFLWLAAYWLELQAEGDRDRRSRLLLMSYLQGPNEAWISVRREPIALRAFTSLPEGLTKEVLTEFARLVSSGLYDLAAKNLASADPAVQERLLERLSQISEQSRGNFAWVLESKDMDHLSVPGVAKRPPRSYWR